MHDAPDLDGASEGPTSAAESGLDGPGGDGASDSADDGADGGPHAEGECGFGEPRIWKLTPRQYLARVRALVPDADPALADALYQTLDHGFRTFTNEAAHLEMSEPHVDQLFASARALAERSTASGGPLAECVPLELDEGCIRPPIERTLAVAFGRPPTTPEIDDYAEFVTAQRSEHGAAHAHFQFVQAILLSPSLLYRTELGPEGADGEAVPLTAYERASALSFFVADAPPDAPLLEAAARGDLEDPDAVEAEVRRLLAGTDAARGIRRFFAESLQVHEMSGVQKNSEVYPEYTEALAADMVTEVELFVTSVLQPGGRVADLVTARHAFVNARLAEHYGLPAPADEGFHRVEFPEDQPRAGLLTHGAVLSRHAKPIEADPVQRGRFIRERLLCQPIPEPPPDIEAVPPDPDGEHTMRELIEQVTSGPTCVTCHALMNPLGFPLEHFDTLGRFRTEQYGLPIDPRGTIESVEGGPFAVDDAVALGQALAQRVEFSDCFVQRLFEYAYGRPPTAADRCALDELRAVVDDTDGDLGELVVALATSDFFFTRRGTR